MKEAFILFDMRQLTRLKPLIIFFLTFSVLFFLFAVTLKYTFPFVAGFLLALAVQPLIRWLKEKIHLTPGLSSAIATLIVFILVFGIMFLLGFWLVAEINNLINNIPRDVGELTSPINNFISRIGEYVSKINSKFIEQNQKQIIDIAQSSAGIIKTVLTSVLSFLTSLPAIFTMFIVMVFSTYFFSKDMPILKKRLLSIFSKDFALNIRSASHHGMNMGSKYILSYLFIYFITFLETLVVFSSLGIPYPLVLSIVTGVADILPVLGPGTIYIPLAIIYLFAGDFFKAGALIICWLLITSIRQIIEPKIIASSINIHPLTMLAAIYFALIANNFWILIYCSALLLLYQILTQLNFLPKLCESNTVAEVPAASSKK